MNRDWRSKGLCLGEDPELWFAVGSGEATDRQIRAAQRICDKCPVKTTCRDWAIENGQEYGVWGGLTEDELQAIKRKRNAAKKQPSTAGLPANARTYLRGAGKRRFLLLVDAGYSLPQIADKLRLGIASITTIATALGVDTDAPKAA